MVILGFSSIIATVKLQEETEIEAMEVDSTNMEADNAVEEWVASNCDYIFDKNILTCSRS
jgi:hypothetical protein